MNTYYLLNKTSLPCIRVISRHRSLEAAEQAEEKLQRQVRRSNGSNSYLMLAIVCADSREVRARVGESEGEAANRLAESKILDREC